MDEALKEILARLDEMSKQDSRRENKMNNIQREISKLKKENEELREENGLMKDTTKRQLMRIVAGKGDKEKKCNLAECRGGKERK